LKSPFKAVDATSSTAIFLVSIARFQHSPNQPLTQIPRGCTQRGKPQIKTKPTSYRGFTLITKTFENTEKQKKPGIGRSTASRDKSDDRVIGGLELPNLVPGEV